MISGVPEHVDGRMIGITEAAGARLINRDRMWHYVEGIRNWSPIWPRHGIRILPGPRRCGSTPQANGSPRRCFRARTRSANCNTSCAPATIIRGSCSPRASSRRNSRCPAPSRIRDLTGKSWLMTARRATNKGAPAPVEAFKTHGADFVVRDNLADLVAAHERAGRRRSAEARSTCRPRSRRATARSPIPMSRTRR